jgi:hypothetical protein
LSLIIKRRKMRLNCEWQLDSRNQVYELSQTILFQFEIRIYKEDSLNNFESGKMSQNFFDRLQYHCII